MSAQLPLALPVGPDQRFDLFVGHDWAIEMLRAASKGGPNAAPIEAGVFVEGAEGSGKSHLLLAACRDAHEAGRRARYLPVAAFAGGLAAMLDGLEANDLVALDGIEAAAASRPDCEALFHLHNRLRDAGRTLLYASRLPAGDAAWALPDLRSRLGQGLRVSLDALDDAAQPFLAQSSVGAAYGSDPANRDRFRQLLPEVQTRVETLSEVPGYVDFLFAEPEMDQKAWDKAMTADAPGWLDAVIAAAQDWPWEAEALHERFMALAEELEANRRKFQAPVRVALTGRSVGPPLFESMVVLGRDAVLDRLRAARAGLGAAG